MKYKLKIFLIILVWVWSCNGGFSKDFINMTGIKGKDISRLFDGDLTKNFNVSNSDQPLAFPFEAYVVLDSIVQVTQFSYYVNNSGQTTGFTVRFLDGNFNQVGVLQTPSIGKYQNWTHATVNYPNVRFLQIMSTNPAIIWDGINEFKITGINVALAPSIYPPTFNYLPVDHGIYAHGINIIGDRINKVVYPTKDTALEKVAKAIRSYITGQDFDYYPNHYFNPKDSTIWLGRYGYNHSGEWGKIMKRRGFHTMSPKSGGGIGWLDSNTAKQNTKWLGGTVAQEKKYAEPAMMYANLIKLYGKSKGKVIAIGGDTTTGQNTTDIFEWDNEPNRWWKAAYYHTPKEYYSILRSVYLKGKQADPYSKIYAGALPGIDTSYWKAVYFQHFMDNKFAPFPADGFNFNMYLNDGTQQREGTIGISPEQYNIRGVLIQLKAFFNRLFGKPSQWTEFGYAADAGSPYEAPNRYEQANWTLRLKAIAQTTFIERMYYYAFFEDGTPNFNTMGAFKDTLVYNPDGSKHYHTVVPYPVAYALGQELYIERNYPWFSEIVKNGGDTGVWVTKKGNLYKIWKATGSGSYTLPVHSKVYRLRYDRFLPDSSTAQVVTASEAMTWAVVDGTTPTPTPVPEPVRTIKAIIKTEYRDSATNKLIRTATATIYLR